MTPASFTFSLTVPNDPEGVTVIAAVAAHADDFAPSLDNTVRMYTCGLTVYARGHIGNFRPFVAVDVLRRALKYVAGYKMHHVMNFTDVDDKTIAGAAKSGLPLREYTDQFITAFRDD